MIVIAGSFEIDPDQRDTFVAAAVAIQQASRLEEGCYHYVWTADLEDPAKVHITEKWTSQEALDNHFSLPHVPAFTTAVKGIIRGSDVLKYQVSSEGPVR